MKPIIVLKCGGSTIETLAGDFFSSVKLLQDLGYAPVLVHGGGPAIKRMLTRLNVESEFVDGLRKTDDEVMEVVEMVLSGTVNNTLVRKLTESGLAAVGLSGCDNRLIEVIPQDEEKLGYVGEITNVNTQLIFTLTARGIVPVIAPVGISQSYERYNINADTAAGAIALRLEAEKLLFVTDVPGILKNGELLAEVTVADVRGLIADGTIYGGMIPKVQAAVDSMQGELREVMIVSAESTIVKDGKMIGTTIRKTEKVTVS